MGMDEERGIYRDEVRLMMGALADIYVDTGRILAVLGYGEDGDEEEEVDSRGVARMARSARGPPGGAPELHRADRRRVGGEAEDGLSAELIWSGETDPGPGTMDGVGGWVRGSALQS